MRRPSSRSPVSGALNIVPNVMTLPHHERSDPEAVLAQLAGRDFVGLTVLGIDGGSGALLEPDGATALGSGNVTVYRDGAWRRYAGGEPIHTRFDGGRGLGTGFAVRYFSRHSSEVSPSAQPFPCQDFHPHPNPLPSRERGQDGGRVRQAYRSLDSRFRGKDEILAGVTKLF